MLGDSYLDSVFQGNYYQKGYVKGLPVTSVGSNFAGLQSAKLLVAVKEIFLNDEHDITFSNSIYEKYVQNMAEIEKGLVDLKLQADVAGSVEYILTKPNF